MSKLPSYFQLPAKAMAKAGESLEWRRPDNQDNQDNQEPIPSLEMLQGMTLREFRTSGLAVVVHCAVLGEAVVWAADGTPTSLKGFDEMGRVVYRGEELRLLTLLGPEDLRAYHSLRKQVGEVQVESIGMAEPEKQEDLTKKKRGAAA